VGGLVSARVAALAVDRFGVVDRFGAVDRSGAVDWFDGVKGGLSMW
jgi:hypothetical protein